MNFIWKSLDIHLIFNWYADCGINKKQHERYSKYDNGGHVIEIIGYDMWKIKEKELITNENRI